MDDTRTPQASEYERGHRAGAEAATAGHDDTVRGLENEIARLLATAPQEPRPAKCTKCGHTHGLLAGPSREATEPHE